MGKAKSIENASERTLQEKANVEAVQQVRDTRSLVIAEGRAIQDMSEESLVRCQALLRHGETFGVWETPFEWTRFKMPSVRNVNISERIHDTLLSKMPAEYGRLRERLNEGELRQVMREAVLASVRYLVLLRMVPASTHGRRYLDVTSISHLAYQTLPKLVCVALGAAALRHEQSSAQLVDWVKERRVFGILDDELLVQSPWATSVQYTFQVEMRRMQMLQRMGLWSGAPDEKVPDGSTTQLKGEGAAKPNQYVQPSTREPHAPFSDEYFGELGWKARWLIENVGPNLPKVLERISDIWREGSQKSWKAKNYTARAASMLATFKWVTAERTRLTEIPFPFKLRLAGNEKSGNEADETGEFDVKGQSSSAAESEAIEFDASEQAELESFQWPPRTFVQLMALTRVVQASNAFVALSSLASRNTEVLSMERNSLVYSSEGSVRAGFKTYKFKASFEGVLRELPLCEFSGRALALQAKLAAGIEKISPVTKGVSPDSIPEGNHLWGQIGGSRSRRDLPMLNGLGSLIRSLVLSLGMDMNPGGQSVRPHRFRKTIARLCGLSIVFGVKVIQEIFGHANAEDALYYMLADEEFRADAEKVARELRIMKGVEVVSAMVEAEDNGAASKEEAFGDERFAGFGGLASVGISEAVSSMTEEARRGKHRVSQESTRELAEVLTMGGQTWNQVREGVFCTKGIDQYAPCNRKKGKPEPQNCNSGCDHRLEEAWHCRDVDASIKDAVRLYKECGERGDDLMQHLWAGQVRLHLARFDSLREKWEPDDTVREILANTTEEA